MNPLLIVINAVSFAKELFSWLRAREERKKEEAEAREAEAKKQPEQ